MDPSPTPAPTPAPPGGPTGVDAPTIDLAAVRADLAAVEAALERLDAGTYGTCEICGEPITDDLLESGPATRSCAAHLGL